MESVFLSVYKENLFAECYIYMYDDDDDYIYYKREGDFIFILPEKIREASLIIFPFYIFLILFRAPKDLKNDDYNPERGKKRKKNV